MIGISDYISKNPSNRTGKKSSNENLKENILNDLTQWIKFKEDYMGPLMPQNFMSYDNLSPLQAKCNRAL